MQRPVQSRFCPDKVNIFFRFAFKTAFGPFVSRFGPLNINIASSFCSLGQNRNFIGKRFSKTTADKNKALNPLSILITDYAQF